jgi:predicted acetyltransferase
MYRFIDVREAVSLMGGYDFGPGKLTVHLNITDSFLPANSTGIVIEFRDGRAKLTKMQSADVELRMDISDFSSLLMGVIQLRRLHTFGLVELSDSAYLEQIDKLFSFPERPVCNTAF